MGPRMRAINGTGCRLCNCSSRTCASSWRGWTASRWAAAALRCSTITPRSSACIPGQQHAVGGLRRLCCTGSRMRLVEQASRSYASKQAPPTGGDRSLRTHGLLVTRAVRPVCGNASEQYRDEPLFRKDASRTRLIRAEVRPARPGTENSPVVPCGY
jgi:hypothetical protein